MRLPSVPLFIVVGVVLHFGLTATTEARAAAHEPSGVVSCADFGGPAAAPADSVAPGPAARPVPVPTPLTAAGLVASESYRDVFRILSTPNRCSEFFGGPAKAAAAFNHFSRGLKRAPLDDPKIALRMSGNYVRYQDHPTGANYRIFEQATLNTHGPIGWASHGQVGRYPGQTPQARALVLLHELGHLVQGPSGQWLLPNDGHDLSLSVRNTRLVEKHCAEQLEAIQE